MENARVHLFIEGRVQGVFYRAFTREIAHRLRLSGWAKNLRDGRVEAVFEGEKRTIEEAIRECRTGPPGAQVTNIDIQWEPYSGDEDGFSVRY
jgi:acylphosphatase